MRKVWEKDSYFHDLMADHLHPGCTFIPSGGFGILPNDPLVMKNSDYAVAAITGMSVHEHMEISIRAQLARRPLFHDVVRIDMPKYRQTDVLEMKFEMRDIDFPPMNIIIPRYEEENIKAEIKETSQKWQPPGSYAKSGRRSHNLFGRRGSSR